MSALPSFLEKPMALNLSDTESSSDAGSKDGEEIVTTVSPHVGYKKVLVVR